MKKVIKIDICVLEIAPIVHLYVKNWVDNCVNQHDLNNA